MPQTSKGIIYNQKFFENILRSMADLLIVIDPDAIIRFANQAVTDVLGYSVEDEDIDDIPIGRLFDDKELQFFGLIKRLIAEGRVRNTGLHMLDKDGEKIPVMLNGTVIRGDDNRIEGMVWVARDMRDVHQLITELAQMNEELEDRVKIRTEELQIAKDESEMALRKLQQVQSQLVQSEKMASIGQLAAGIAHEINNPAGFVSSNVKTLEEYIKDIKSLFIECDSILKNTDLKNTDLKNTKRITDEDILTWIRNLEEKKQAIDLPFILQDIDQILCETQEGMRRINKIVKDLREFSHAGSDKPEYADLNKCIDSTLNIVWNELKYKTEVVTLYGDIPQVLCYPQQLNQVLMNLLVNAAQAIKGKGVIKVKTSAENNRAVIEIYDTGEGIPHENLSRIFEPFFTTKPVGKGTGLGLAVAYAIIQKHGGDIKVDSEVGKGTCFSVSIPIEYEQFRKMI